MEGKNNKITNAIKMYAGNKVLYLKKNVLNFMD